MVKRTLLLLITYIFIVSAAFAAEDNTQWGYEGETGPEYWAELDPKFSGCKGFNQSPINISNTTRALLSDITFDYHDVVFNMLNNGHTIQLNYAGGSSISVDGRIFDLQQFHFHSPSENHINGMSYPMEVQLVHKDADGNLGVIGVMFKEGAENPMIKGLWGHLKEAVVGQDLVKEGIQINAYGILPSNKEYYRFNGSLTTPPCSEGVMWMVMKEPLEISSRQVRQFVNLIGRNNRPIQSVNARPILR